MKIDPAIFRAYDVRGKVGESLTPEVVEAIGQAFGSHIKSEGGQQVSVSRDNRESSRPLATDFIRGVLSTGVNVIDLGLTTTPMLYFSIIKFDFDGGAIITGSHAAVEYNGIKLCKKQVLHIAGDELKEIQKLVEDENFISGRGQLTKQDIFDEYEAEILRRIKLSRSLRIAVDCGDGATGNSAPDIFEALGCQVFRYACKPLGEFFHGGSDPSVPENLEDLEEIVVHRDHDLGIGFDADGDRLGVVDDGGNYVPAEKIAAVIARDILGGFRKFFSEKKKFICDAKSLLVFKTVVEDAGGQVEISPVGRSFLRQKLFEDPEVLLAVGAAGHIHINHNFFGFDDATFAAARLLEILSKSRKSLSKLISEFPRSFYTPEIRFPYPDEKKFELVEEVCDSFSKKYDTIEVDGVRAKLDEKSWFLVRAKNTGPYLSLRFEADTEEKVLEMIGIVAEELKKYPDLDQKWINDAKTNISS